MINDVLYHVDDDEDFSETDDDEDFNPSAQGAFDVVNQSTGMLPVSEPGEVSLAAGAKPAAARNLSSDGLSTVRWSVLDAPRAAGGATGRPRPRRHCTHYGAAGRMRSSQHELHEGSCR